MMLIDLKAVRSGMVSRLMMTARPQARPSYEDSCHGLQRLGCIGDGPIPPKLAPADESMSAGSPPPRIPARERPEIRSPS